MPTTTQPPSSHVKNSTRAELDWLGVKTLRAVLDVEPYGSSDLGGDPSYDDLPCLLSPSPSENHNPEDPENQMRKKNKKKRKSTCPERRRSKEAEANRVSLIRIFSTAGYGRIRQDTAQYGTIRQDTAGYGRIRQKMAGYGRIRRIRLDTAGYGRIRQIRQDTAVYRMIRQDTAGYGRIRWDAKYLLVSSTKTNILGSFGVRWHLILFLPAYCDVSD